MTTPTRITREDLCTMARKLGADRATVLRLGEAGLASMATTIVLRHRGDGDMEVSAPGVYQTRYTNSLGMVEVRTWTVDHVAVGDQVWTVADSAFVPGPHS